MRNHHVPSSTIASIASVLLAACAVTLGAGCNGSPGNPDGGDDLAIADMTAVPFNITALYASELDFDVMLGNSPGGATTKLSYTGIWQVLLGQGGTPIPIEVVWGPMCAITVPGVGAVPAENLDSYLWVLKNGSVTAATTGATLTQPGVTLLYGVQLANPATDTLPTASAVSCSGPSATNCTVPDPDTQLPGLVLPAPASRPDLLDVSIALRVRFSFSAVVASDATLNGTVSDITVEDTVLGCNHPDMSVCTAAEVSALAATVPAVTATSGTLRSHAQGGYFTCPLFNSNPPSALIANTCAPSDAGTGPTPDLGTTSLGIETFRGTIQPDLDERGCATRGCHQAGHSVMPLLYSPTTDAERHQNYDSVLPYARIDRLPNQAPIPADMHARWERWIAEGMPY